MNYDLRKKIQTYRKQYKRNQKKSPNPKMLYKSLEAFAKSNLSLSQDYYAKISIDNLDKNGEFKQIRTIFMEHSLSNDNNNPSSSIEASNEIIHQHSIEKELSENSDDESMITSNHDFDSYSNYSSYVNEKNDKVIPKPQKTVSKQSSSLLPSNNEKNFNESNSNISKKQNESEKSISMGNSSSSEQFEMESKSNEKSDKDFEKNKNIYKYDNKISKTDEKIGNSKIQKHNKKVSTYQNLSNIRPKSEELPVNISIKLEEKCNEALIKMSTSSPKNSSNNLNPLEDNSNNNYYMVTPAIPSMNFLSLDIDKYDEFDNFFPHNNLNNVININN